MNLFSSSTAAEGAVASGAEVAGEAGSGPLVEGNTPGFGGLIEDPSMGSMSLSSGGKLSNFMDSESMKTLRKINPQFRNQMRGTNLQDQMRELGKMLPPIGM